MRKLLLERKVSRFSKTQFLSFSCYILHLLRHCVKSWARRWDYLTFASFGIAREYCCFAFQSRSREETKDELIFFRRKGEKKQKEQMARSKTCQYVGLVLHYQKSQNASIKKLIWIMFFLQSMRASSLCKTWGSLSIPEWSYTRVYHTQSEHWAFWI